MVYEEGKDSKSVRTRSRLRFNSVSILLQKSHSNHRVTPDGSKREECGTQPGGVQPGAGGMMGQISLGFSTAS